MNLIDSSLFCGIYIQILNKIERCTRHRVMFGEDVFVPKVIVFAVGVYKQAACILHENQRTR